MAAASVSISNFLAQLLANEQQIFEKFIEAGGNVNEEIEYFDDFSHQKLSTTPLVYFTENRRPNIIKMFLDKGANVNKAGSDGFTPLHIAAQFGFDEIVKLLLEKGADITIKTSDGKTALDLTTSDKIKQLLVSKAGGRRRLQRGFTHIARRRLQRSKKSKSRKSKTHKHKSKTRKH